MTRDMTVTGAMEFNAEIQAAETLWNDGTNFSLIVTCSSISEIIEE